ncbi:hypothetical protein K3495_g5347 [Podosphaera aphanis]|nr:hypothetical protein K3495_g5347 [Podosphaera aphanis]
MMASKSQRLSNAQSGSDGFTQSTQRPRGTAPSDEESEGNNDDNGSDVHNQAVKKLVRYALSCEYQRQVIKRAGITEKVIGKQSCNFRQVFQDAQKQLRSRFGMELVELPLRQKVTMKEKKSAQKTKGAAKSSAAYVLKTVLPSEYRKSDIMYQGSNRSSADEAVYMGLYTVIISLISLSADGQMANHQLDKYLKRLNLDRNTGLGTTIELLTKMKKEGYLQEYKTHDEEGQTSEWRVGPRGAVEVDKAAVRGFVTEIYGENAPVDLENRLLRSLGASANTAEIIREAQDEA